MKHSTAVADLSGGNASAVSLTPRSVIFAAEYARDFASSLLLDVAPRSFALSEGFFFPLPGTGRGESGAAPLPRLYHGEWLEELSKEGPITYR